MRLNTFRVTGYQSFSDSGELKFSDGINLLVGANNSGKSALLRAMQPVLDDDRHRTPGRWQQHQMEVPEVIVQFHVSGPELKDALLRRGGSIHVPVPSRDVINYGDFLEYFWSRDDIPIGLRQQAGQMPSSERYPSHGLFFLSQGDQPMSVQAVAQNGQLISSNPISNDGDQLAEIVRSIWDRDVFYFKAERLSIGESAAESVDRLAPDASNLPAVLNTLQSDRADVFDRLVAHLRKIFSTIGNLTVSVIPGSVGRVEILVWPTEARQRRELSFPLLKSGTGVAQVTAILTAIMTIDKGIFIIDEINSFLHPAAVKTLLRIMQTDYAHHQYIISTHAPEVIGSSNASTIHLVKRDGYESHVQPIDVTSVRAFQEIAANLGVSMSDVLAADQVVWVEGPTEELCFSHLYQKRVGPLPRRLAFSVVSSTGDFNRKRDAELVFEIYRKVSALSPALQVKTAFSFDTELLNDKEKAELRKKAGGDLFFLPRRHLECYLLDETAIAEFIVDRDPQSDGHVTPQTVRTAIVGAAASQKFKKTEWKGDIRAADWLAKVDAANLIDFVCTSQSHQRVTFNKKEDSLFLLQSILDREPERLDPLVTYVKRLIDAVAKLT